MEVLFRIKREVQCGIVLLPWVTDT